MINPLKSLEVNRFILRHPKIDEHLAGFHVAHVTDIHLGPWIKPRHLLQVVEFVEEQDPDLVALTGDYVGYNKRKLPDCIETLGEFVTPAFATLGNHDHWTSTEISYASFEEAGIPLLSNESVSFEFNGTTIDVVGVDDEVTEHADVDRAHAGIDNGRFCLTLNHVPSIAWDCADAGSNLILSGHTHGFQFNIPRITHAIAERFGTELFAGPYRLDDAMLYISRGLGSASWPRRFRAKPEIAFFDFAPGEIPEFELVSSEEIEIDHSKYR